MLFTVACRYHMHEMSISPVLEFFFFAQVIDGKNIVCRVITLIIFFRKKVSPNKTQKVRNTFESIRTNTGVGIILHYVCPFEYCDG